MDNTLDSTTLGPCRYCRISGRASSRIRDEPANCLKNRHGTCLGCQKLSEVERKIEEARRTLNNLLDEREALASALNDYHDPLARWLPVEVTSRIFLHSQRIKPSAHTSYQQYNEKVLIKSVFAPGHVCQTWRKIARGTPKLWSIICITLTRSNCMNSLSFVGEWLKLSSELPLFIQLDIGADTDEVVCSFSRKIMSLMIQHCHRWEVLDLSVSHHLMRWISDNLPNQYLGGLQHLKLNTSSDNAPPSSVLSLQAFPRLLTQGNVWLRQLSVDMSQLTDFYVPNCYLTGDESAQLLEGAPRLSTCLLNGVDGTPSSENYIQSSSLKTLTIKKFPGEWWNKFTFPSLEVLNVAFPSDETSWIRLQALLRRSRCRLQEFTIHDNRKPQLEVIDVIKLTPALRRFEVQGNLLQEPFFRLLDEAMASASTTQTTAAFLNNLVSLSCTTGNATFSWTWLVIFLSTMMSRPERSLCFFEFQYQEKFSNDIETHEGTLTDKDMFKLVRETLKDVEFKILDCDGGDVMDWLRDYHNM